MVIYTEDSQRRDTLNQVPPRRGMLNSPRSNNTRTIALSAAALVALVLVAGMFFNANRNDQAGTVNSPTTQSLGDKNDRTDMIDRDTNDKQP